MKKVILKLLGFYREPDATKQEDARVKPVRISLAPKSYLSQWPFNDLEKINKNYQTI